MKEHDKTTIIAPREELREDSREPPAQSQQSEPEESNTKKSVTASTASSSTSAHTTSSPQINPTNVSIKHSDYSSDDQQHSDDEQGSPRKSMIEYPPPEKRVRVEKRGGDMRRKKNKFADVADDSEHEKGDSDDALQKRMEANRIRARDMRKKKKKMIEEMNTKIVNLTIENQQLKNLCSSQKSEIQSLRQILMSQSSNNLNNNLAMQGLVGGLQNLVQVRRYVLKWIMYYHYHDLFHRKRLSV